MNRKQRKLARFTDAEEKIWLAAFYFHKDRGLTDDAADQRAWRDVVKEFPRLKSYDGALP